LKTKHIASYWGLRAIAFGGRKILKCDSGEGRLLPFETETSKRIAAKSHQIKGDVDWPMGCNKSFVARPRTASGRYGKEQWS